MENKRITDVLLERPTGFELAGRHFYLFPQTLGSSQLIGNLLAELNLNKLNEAENILTSLTNIIAANLDTCLRIIAYSVIQGKGVLDNQQVNEVIQFLKDKADVSNIVMLMHMILSVQSTDDIKQHYGIDKELKEYARICEGKDNGGTLVYCGKSIWGNTISALAEKYGWTIDYILWGISHDNISMLLADAPKTIYLSEDEIKRLHPKQGAMRADDPANYAAIMAMNWN